MDMKGTKVAIIGAAGMVGSAFAYALAIRGAATEIVLIDRDEDRAMGQAMDISHGVPYIHHMDIYAGSYDDCKNASIVVITAGAAQKPGETRLDLVRRNTAIFKDIIPRVAQVAPDAILLIVTNPVDVMTYVALKLSRFDKRRVIGSGTTLDSARLRYELSRHCQIDPRNIHAYIIGEHGDSEVPVWSLANIAGTRLNEYCPVCPRACPTNVKDEMFLKVKNAAYEVINKKGATYWGIGLALEAIVSTIVRDQRSVLTVSTLLEDDFGMSDLCLSLPTVLGREGVVKKIALQLSEEETKLFQQSATVIKGVINELDLD